MDQNTSHLIMQNDQVKVPMSIMIHDKSNSVFSLFFWSNYTTSKLTSENEGIKICKFKIS